ncbi:MAG: 50S ribosomal protein L9 [Dehalococcoidia bacterium]|nr:50S ribosomal protein L9 [Dehalococcoidia bacterium]
MRVRILFLQDVPPRYLAGEIREVAQGYARNYLIPQGLAAPATKGHLNRVAAVKRAAEGRRKVQAVQVSDLAARLQGVSITVQARAGEGGRLYGAVTNMTIAQELQKSLGVVVDRRLIDLPEAIRTVGTFQVPVRLAAEQTPTITVNVQGITPSEQEGAAVAAGQEGEQSSVRGEDAAP